MKIIIFYSPTIPDDEKGEKWVDCFYTDLFKVLKEDIPSRKVGTHTLTLGDLNARTRKEQLTELRSLASFRAAEQETNLSANIFVVLFDTRFKSR